MIYYNMYIYIYGVNFVLFQVDTKTRDWKGPAESEASGNRESLTGASEKAESTSNFFAKTDKGNSQTIQSSPAETRLL